MPVTALRSAAIADAAPTPSATAQVSAFLRGFSVEATRPSGGDLAALKATLPGGAAVYLSAIPNQSISELIEAAVRVRAQGFEPVPHIAARTLESRAMLDDLLSRLTTWAGVRRVLAIAGDRERTEGPFGSALDLIESGLLQRHGIEETGIAGYPDGHPRIAPEALDRALLGKIEAASQTGLRIGIVTQFAFDPAAILRWVGRLRDMGIEHPVRIGMAGPADLSTLLRYARRCGVRASAQGLARRAGLIKHLLGASAPDRIVRAVAEAQAGRPLGRVSAHFFSFGGVGATARWATAAAAGRIVIDRTDGFGVEPP